MHKVTRRQFIVELAAGSSAFAFTERSFAAREKPYPNIVYVFADQWRAQATGYNGDINAKTPNLDALAAQSCNFVNAVSGCPVCSPYRASLLTGQYPLTHGVFLNDVQLNDDAITIAKVLGKAGYNTGYIGKWHVHDHGRSAFIPKESRQGFEFWQTMECTHNYNHSYYYGDANKKLLWPGYDAIAQTKEAQKYIRVHADDNAPFALFLSWGPPHTPYQTAPKKYREMVNKNKIELRPNVPQKFADKAREDLSGYYAHIMALDDCIGDILKTLKDTKIEENTIFIFTSDHGDMLYSQGMTKKQKPFEESARVPFLLRWPAVHGNKGKDVDVLLNSPDIMPTLLGLCGIDIPNSVEGEDLSGAVCGDKKNEREAALLTCPSPFGQWIRKHGGREYRGVRTKRYTFVRDLKGPWLLYDNEKDPYQMENLCDNPKYAMLQSRLDKELNFLLRQTHDEFLPGPEYIKKWGYTVDEDGTVPYSK